MTQLLHHGREMNRHPINMTFSRLVSLLRRGETCHVVIEPGDGTRYELLIVPQNNGLVKLDGVSFDSLFVVLIDPDMHTGKGTILTTPKAVGSKIARDLRPTISWTATLLTWWLTDLLAATQR